MSAVCVTSWWPRRRIGTHAVFPHNSCSATDLFGYSPAVTAEWIKTPSRTRQVRLLDHCRLSNRQLAFATFSIILIKHERHFNAYPRYRPSWLYRRAVRPCRLTINYYFRLLLFRYLFFSSQTGWIGPVRYFFSTRGFARNVPAGTGGRYATASMLAPALRWMLTIDRCSNPDAVVRVCLCVLCCRTPRVPARYYSTTSSFIRDTDLCLSVCLSVCHIEHNESSGAASLSCRWW